MLTVPDAVARELGCRWDTFAADPSDASTIKVGWSRSRRPDSPWSARSELERRLLPRKVLPHCNAPRPHYDAKPGIVAKKELRRCFAAKARKTEGNLRHAAEIIWMFSIDTACCCHGTEAARSGRLKNWDAGKLSVAYISALRLVCRVMHPAPVRKACRCITGGIMVKR